MGNINNINFESDLLKVRSATEAEDERKDLFGKNKKEKKKSVSKLNLRIKKLVLDSIKTNKSEDIDYDLNQLVQLAILETGSIESVFDILGIVERKALENEMSDLLTKRIKKAKERLSLLKALYRPKKNKLGVKKCSLVTSLAMSDINKNIFKVDKKILEKGNVIKKRKIKGL